ncbi:hypothetical protein [Thalassoglobus sp.]|uniref:hypothetical protein n=1 Tax=Thalassoglobus sp. TaxID=2795869 RepID=UPI003AA860A6
MATKKWTEKSLKQASEKPTSIAPQNYASDKIPSGYKLCTLCEHYVRGPQTKVCPNCQGDIAPKSRQPGGRKRANAATAIGSAEFTKVMNLIENLGGLKPTLSTIDQLEKFGSIEEARRLIKAWSSLVEATGSEAKASAAIESLQKSGAI